MFLLNVSPLLETTPAYAHKKGATSNQSPLSTNSNPASTSEFQVQTPNPNPNTNPKSIPTPNPQAKQPAKNVSNRSTSSSFEEAPRRPSSNNELNQSL